MKCLRTISIVFAMIIFLTGCSSKEWDNPTGETNDPHVISVIPPRAADGVGTGDNIVAFFNKDIDPSTINMGNFYVYNYDWYVSATVGTESTRYQGNPAKVPGVYSYNAGQRAAIFSPRYLTAETSYIAILTTGIRDTSGRAMLTGYSWGFSTKSQETSITANKLR